MQSDYASKILNNEEFRYSDEYFINWLDSLLVTYGETQIDIRSNGWLITDYHVYKDFVEFKVETVTGEYDVDYLRIPVAVLKAKNQLLEANYLGLKKSFEEHDRRRNMLVMETAREEAQLLVFRNISARFKLKGTK